MKPIVVLGSINQDLVFTLPRLPRPGETITAADFQLFPGGKGANQAVAAARLGGDVSMVGCVGEDVFGRQLVAGLKAEGVDCTYLQVVSEPTGCAGIGVLPDGENSIAIYGGANAKVVPERLAQTVPILESAGVLMLQLEIPLDTVEWAAQIAASAGVPIILDPAPAQPLSPGVLSLIDVLTPNAAEATDLTGIDVHCWKTAARAATNLREQGAKNVLVTMGKFGAYFSGPDGEVRINTPAVEAVDTTAAGDAFVGALAMGLVYGLPVDQAADIAAAAGALAVTKHGARPSLPTISALRKVVNTPW
ncbi:MAG: ribokinase [Firmicutes bacterium]|nr:ribokinase [Bacillota bacterium]